MRTSRRRPHVTEHIHPPPLPLPGPLKLETSTTERKGFFSWMVTRWHMSRILMGIFLHDSFMTAWNRKSRVYFWLRACFRRQGLLGNVGFRFSEWKSTGVFLWGSALLSSGKRMLGNPGSLINQSSISSHLPPSPFPPMEMITSGSRRRQEERKAGKGE